MPPPESDSIAPGPRDFGTTHWSLVLTAKGAESSAHAALSNLCRAYWYPLYAFVRRQGFSAHDAQDLTQEFFARLLEKQWLGSVDRELGRFRSWLLASMKHFLANDWDRRHAQKRGGSATVVSMDADAEFRYANEPADPMTPERVFNRRWALTLLDLVISRLSEEAAAAGKSDQFEALKGTLAGERTRYAEIALRLHTSEGAVKIAVHRLRGRYKTLLRAEIAQTVATPAEVEDELRHLFSALG